MTAQRSSLGLPVLVAVELASAVAASSTWWSPSAPPKQLPVVLVIVNVIALAFCVLEGVRRDPRVYAVIIAVVINVAMIATTASLVAYEGRRQCIDRHGADAAASVHRSYDLAGDTLTCTFHEPGKQKQKITLRPWAILKAWRDSASVKDHSSE